MAKKEIAKAQVFLDGKQAQTVIDQMQASSKELRKELKKAFEVGDQDKIKKLTSDIKKNEMAMRSVKKATFDYEAVLKNINGASFNDLNKALKTTQGQLKRMKQTDAGYKDKEAQVQQLKTKISQLNSKTRATTSIWSKFANSANKYMGMITAGLAAMTGIGFSVAQLIKGLTGLDDELANVQKTTGMARKEVRELYGEFKTLNTRTKKSVLLEYAEEAGRLGKKGKKDVLEFVAVANKIGTALGDDLGDAPTAIREVGKLVNIYKVGNQHNVGFGESMEKIGSAINEVAANSSASAGYQIEYLKRLSGTAKQAKITADQILGFSSVLDQNGQAVEMAATAQGKLMIDMFTKSGEYAELAGMKLKDFQELLETDANEAFLKFLEGINGDNEGFSKMALRLDDLGVSGARAVQVLTTLASNTDNIRKEQLLANKAMKEGVSLTNEYEVKNNNLAGSWEKLSKAIKAKFINPQLIGFMEKLISSTAKLTETKLSDTLRKERTEVNLLTLELTNHNTPQERRQEIYDQLKEISPDIVKGINLEKIEVGLLTENLRKFNEVQIKKIALQSTEEALEEKREKAGKATSIRLERETELNNTMLKIREKIANDKYLQNNVNEKLGISYEDLLKNIDNVLYADDDLITKQKNLQKITEGLAKEGLIYASVSTLGANATYELEQALTDEEKAMKSVEQVADEFIKKQNQLFGPKDNNNEESNTPTTPDEKPIIKTKLRTIEVINAEISARQKEQKELSDTAEAYQNYQDKITALEIEREKITGDTAKAEAEKKAKAEAEAEAAKAKKKAQELLQEYETYLEKRHRLIQEYEQKRNDLIDAGGSVGNLAVLNAEEDQHLQEIDRKILEKQKTFEAWTASMTAMGLEALSRALTQAQMELISGKQLGISEEQLAALRAKIEAMKAQIKALKSEGKTAESSKEKWDETVRVMNDVQQNVQNIISQFDGLNDTTKQALESAMNISAGVIAMITGISTLATTSVTAIRAVETASVILAVIGAALQIIIAIFNFAKKIHDKKYDKEVEKLQDSIEELQTAYEKLERTVDKTFGNAKKAAIDLQKENIKLQQQAIQQQIDSEKGKKDPDQDKIKEWEQTIKDLGTNIEDLPTLADVLIGDDALSAVETFANAWIDAWKNGEDVIKSQEDLVDNMIENIVRTLMSEKLQNAIGNLRTAIASAMEDGEITENEWMFIHAMESHAQAEAQSFQDQLEFGGFTFGDDGTVSDDSDLNNNSGTAGFAKMEQETANELNGRFTALQASNEVIKLETIKFGSVMEDMKGMQLTIYTVLVDIKENTDQLPIMAESLTKIEKYLKDV